jgi:hypothetical protein
MRAHRLGTLRIVSVERPSVRRISKRSSRSTGPSCRLDTGCFPAYRPVVDVAAVVGGLGESSVVASPSQDEHREQRPVDATSPLQHHREEGSLAWLRDSTLRESMCPQVSGVPGEGVEPPCPLGASGFKPHSSVGTRPLGATGCALICDFAVTHRHLCGPVPCCSGPFVSKALADKRVEHADRRRRSCREPPASLSPPRSLLDRDPKELVA